MTTTQPQPGAYTVDLGYVPSEQVDYEEAYDAFVMPAQSYQLGWVTASTGEHLEANYWISYVAGEACVAAFVAGWNDCTSLQCNRVSQ